MADSGYSVNMNAQNLLKMVCLLLGFLGSWFQSKNDLVLENIALRHPRKPDPNGIGKGPPSATLGAGWNLGDVGSCRVLRKRVGVPAASSNLSSTCPDDPMNIRPSMSSFSPGA